MRESEWLLSGMVLDQSSFSPFLFGDHLFHIAKANLELLASGHLSTCGIVRILGVFHCAWLLYFLMVLFVVLGIELGAFARVGQALACLFVALNVLKLTL